MIKIIEDMPHGTIGVEAVGKVTEQDYREVLLPAITPALKRDDLRLLTSSAKTSIHIHPALFGPTPSCGHRASRRQRR
jgi:hypothetical protein